MVEIKPEKSNEIGGEASRSHRNSQASGDERDNTMETDCGSI